MKKIRISLMFKIATLCVLLIMISSLAFGTFAYRTAKETMVATMGQTAMNITRSVAATIDGDKHQELLTADDMNSEYYKATRDELIKIRRETGLKYLYTLSKVEDGSFYYVLDGSDYDSEEESLLGDVEADISDMMVATFDGNEGYEICDSEEWGTLVSGYIPIKNSEGEVVAMLGADFDAKHMMDMLSIANYKMIWMQIIILIFGIVASVFFSYWIVRYIKQLNSKVKLIENGDLSVKIDDNRSDEVGSLARSFQRMVNNMSLMIRNIRNISDDVIRDVDTLNNNVDISNKSTEEITKIVSVIADGAVKQVDSVSEVEDSMKRVLSQIEVITKKVNSVNESSDISIREMQEASEKLNGSAKQINLVNDTADSTSVMMQKLQEKFKNVLSISSSINAIASRTNLLALNASIEAASAGEHGKGFSIVAQEIKNLAKRSSEESRRINDVIISVQEEISNSSASIENGVVLARDGVNAISEVEQNLDKVSNSNSKINKRIKEIEEAILVIKEDSKNVLNKTSMLTGISRELSSGTQQTVAETEEQYAIMEGIRNDLYLLKKRMGELESTVNEFTISQ